MKRVWKERFSIDDYVQLVNMPRGAKLLRVGMQDGLSLWYEWSDTECDSALPRTEKRAFAVHGTGHPVDDNEQYVGTAEDHRRNLVWHLYEVK
jgi:hypothetical protein